MASWATVRLDGNGASTAGTSVVYAYRGDYASYLVWYTSQSTSTEYKITYIPTLPKRTYYSFKGFYSASSGGTQKVPDSGSLVFLEPSDITAQTVTWYAQWKRFSYRLHLDKQGGDDGASNRYFKVGTAGKWFTTWECENESTSVSVPTRSGYVFKGYYNAESGGGKKYINADGSYTSNMTSLTLTANKTIYAAWERHFTLSFDANGGDVTPTSKDVIEGNAIGDLPTPTREHYHFDGWYTAAEGGTVVTAETVYEWSSDITLFGHWTKNPILTFDANGGTVSEETRECWYGDALGTLPRPTLSGFFFDGWYTAAEGGSLVAAETTYDWQGDATIYAHWTEDEQYRLMFDANGGATAESERIIRPGDVVGELPTAVYDKHEFDGWWTARTGGTQWTAETVFDRRADLNLYAHWTRTEFTITFDARGGTSSFTTKEVTLHEAVGDLPTCEKYANTFLGWFDAANGGTQWTNFTEFDRASDTTLYAHWFVDPSFERNLILNANGGTVSPTSIICTYGLSIGIIPKPERPGKIFKGWFTATSGGTRYDDGTVCSWTGTKTVYARWSDDVFGNLTDYFDLETANGPLMLVASNPGSTRTVIETSHTGALAIQSGDSSVGAFKTFGILLNPVCTYRIRKEGSVTINLGAAWTGSGATKSGYMLVNAEYSTEADGEPVLVVRGAANEGAPAINRWSANLNVNPDHIAQDPMNAVSGGGELTECKTLVTCDPVVPMENGMPCASDIVHGKVIVRATTNAYGGENAPTARSPFIETNGVQPDESDVDFTTYAITAERSL